jgi:hypothetical protein
VLRSLVRDPKPILWNLLGPESDWLPFLLLLLLVFSRNHLYGPRELREARKIVSSVVLVTASRSRSPSAPASTSRRSACTSSRRSRSRPRSTAR